MSEGLVRDFQSLIISVKSLRRRKSGGITLQYRLPDFSFEWYHYLKRPWRFRWRLKSIQSHFGRRFSNHYEFLNRSLQWSEEELERYQWKKLSALIKHAYETTPFYRETFKGLGLMPEDIRSQEDFRRIPITSRSHLEERLEDFKSSEYERYGGSPASTSGSSGSVLHFYRSWETESMRRAVQWRLFNQMGYFFKQPRVSLNKPFVREEEDLLYTYDPIDNVVAFNGRFLRSDCIKVIYDIIRKFEPVMFYGHPSAVVNLATQMKIQNLKPLNLQACYVYSEVVSKPMRTMLERMISSRIHDHYGNRENTVSASQLRCGRYHINSEFTYMELVESEHEFSGRKCYRVIGTNLVNLAMPTIRYDCGDLAYRIGRCDRCDLAHPTIEFVGGRQKNFLVARDGLIHCQIDDILLMLGFEATKDIQIEQVDLDTIILRYVPGPTFEAERDRPILVKELAKATGDRFEIRLDEVSEIKPTEGFKQNKIISRLGEDLLESS